MSGYKERAASPSGSKLQPTVLHDTLGAYISVIRGIAYLEISIFLKLMSLISLSQSVSWLVANGIHRQSLKH